MGAGGVAAVTAGAAREDAPHFHVVVVEGLPVGLGVVVVVTVPAAAVVAAGTRISAA